MKNSVTGGLKEADRLSWPPQSQDWISLNIFLWGYVKSNVYSAKPQYLVEELQPRIIEVIEIINAKCFPRTTKSGYSS